MTLKRFDNVARLRVPQFDEFIRSLLAVFCERAVHDEWAQTYPLLLTTRREHGTVRIELDRGHGARMTA